MATKTKAKPKTKAKGKVRAKGGTIDNDAIRALLEDNRLGYHAKLQAFRKLIPVWSMEDIIAACQMEIEILGTSAEKSGTRSAYLRLMIDAQKWAREQEGAERTIVINIDHGDDKGL